MADLSMLSHAEREVLLLLADGHTAKSAAVQLGVSVNTVNERLRSARSKARAGSSRELARLVRDARDGAQENCSKQIGVGQSHQVSARRASQPILRLRVAVTRGTLAMIIVAVTAGTLAVYMLSGVFASGARSSPAPRVESTYPAPNTEAPAGKLTLRVTFDRPMRPASYSFVMLSPQTYPHCASTPMQSADGRSFTLECTIEAHHAYDIGFNSARFQNFVAAEDNVPAIPANLHFSTQ